MYILPAIEEDIPFLVRLINESYRGESNQGWTSEKHLLDGVRITPEQMFDQMLIPSGQFFKYQQGNDKPLGNVYLEIEEDSLYLGMLAVSPESQGKGIGKAILDFAFEYACKNQLKRVYLTVLSQRKELLEWYKKHGYKPSGHSKPFQGDNTHYIPKIPLDLIYMEKWVQGH